MLSTPLHELIPVLQIAIGPVILISGISLLLLTLTNRFGRTIDRSRQLVREMRDAPSSQQQLAGQVNTLYRRARVIRLSIIAAAAGLLLASILIIALFLTALMKVEAGLLISLFFICCMLSLMVSLVAFVKDVQLSLVALSLELGCKTAGVETEPCAGISESRTAWLANV